MYFSKLQMIPFNGSRRLVQYKYIDVINRLHLP